jgi:hypothetical protein
MAIHEVFGQPKVWQVNRVGKRGDLVLPFALFEILDPFRSSVPGDH